MASLPYTRIVNATLTKLDNFPTREGFGTPLIISDIVSDVVAAAVDASTPVKAYGSLDEIAVDWGSDTGVYAAAQDIYQQDITPIQIKVGYVLPTTALTITAGLDAIEQFDNNFYWGLPAAAAASGVAAWHDNVTLLTAMVDWFETKSKILGILSNDANTESKSDTSTIAYFTKNSNYARTFVAYHDDATGESSLHALIAAYGATRNLDDADSSYTMNFKPFNGIAAVDKGSAAVQAVTGFVPGLGLDDTEGHMATTYINIGGVNMTHTGSMSDGGFIDEKHFEDWLIARTQEEVVALFTNSAKVPYTDKGFDQVVQAVQRVLNRALTNGSIAEFEDVNGDIRNWLISVPRVASIAASQRRQRIMPTIAVKFRYAGAIHYTTINYTMAF